MIAAAEYKNNRENDNPSAAVVKKIA